MSISGVGQNYHHNNVATTKNENNTEKFALEKTGSTQELSEAEEMELFKKEFYAELERIPKNRTITNLAVNISEEAFKNMKDNPEYRAKIMSALQRDLTSSFAPLKALLLITIGATEKDYRGDSWSGPNNDSEFYACSQNSFYKKTSGQKDRNKELLEEYLEKRAQAKRQQQEMLNEKIAKAEQERSRLAKAWAGERQMAAASNAYDANVMTETAAGRKVTERLVNLSISNEGRNMLREMVNKFEPDSDYVNARELTIQNTNEVAWEHYTAMRGISSQTLKDGNYNVEDVMKSIMDTYEARYNEIVKEHENGDRGVSYGLTGKRSLTLEEDLAGLDEAFKMRLANLEGYIACQQTNRAFENPDSSWLFSRNGSQNEGRTQDRIPLFDTEYRDSAVSIMKQTREKFLAAFKSFGYKKGTAIGILADVLNENTSFVANTRKLFK